MKVSVIHPSRSRPEMALETAKKWIERAKVPFEYILSLDQSDPRLDDYVQSIITDIVSKTTIFPNENAIQAVNKGAEYASGNIIIVISDDFDCLDNWLIELLKAVNGKTDFVLKTFDGAQKWIVTLPIMDRTYYNSKGYVYNPIYTHLFPDTELTHIAELEGKLIVRNDLLFKHHHELTSTSKNPDEVTKKANATWEEGERTYLQRVRENFGMTEVNARKVSYPPHQNWLNSKL